MKSLILPLAILGGLAIALIAGTGALLVVNGSFSASPEEPSTKAGKPTTPAKTVKRDDLKPDSLPEVPQASGKSKLKELNKEKTLYIETMEDGTKKLHVAAEVCLREGVLLEVLLCKKQTKEHEAILRIDLDAKLLHAGLVAIGAKPGSPVQFVNPKTEQPEYKPASGTVIDIDVHYSRDGKPQSHKAQDWIIDKSTKKAMAHDWVFAGSRFVKWPDKPDEPEYYCANNGEVIAVSNFVDSMLDLPVQLSGSDDELTFEADYTKVPAVGSMVWVTLSPRAEKKK